jgi:hypothetical protein
MAGLSASDIVEYAAREGNEFIENQINMSAKLFATLDKVPMKGKRAVINVVAGGVSSTKQIADYGVLPDESGNEPAQGFVDAVAYVSRIGFGRIAMDTLAGVDDSADLVDLHLELAAKDMARQIGRAMYGSQLLSPTSGTVTQAGGAGEVATMTIVFTGGLSDFRVGEAYQYESALAAAVSADHANLLLCTDVQITTDTTSTVTFICGPGGVPGFDTGAHADSLMLAANTNGLIRTGDAFFLRGARVEPVASTGVVTDGRDNSNASPVSLGDVVGTGSLHGISAGTNGWRGVDFTSAAVPTQQLFIGKSQLLQALNGDVAPTHLVLGNLAAASYAVQQVTAGAAGFGASTLVQPRRAVDGKLDMLGPDADSDSGLRMFGRPVIVDPNCPAAHAFLINKQWLKVGEWKKLRAEDEGGSPLLLSRSTFSREVQFSCIYNLLVRKRNAHARIALTLS